MTLNCHMRLEPKLESGEAGNRTAGFSQGIDVSPGGSGARSGAADERLRFIASQWAGMTESGRQETYNCARRGMVPIYSAPAQ